MSVTNTSMSAAAPSRQACYRSRSVELSVEFALTKQTIQTIEGPVSCQAGDAIVTGMEGERWPISAQDFPRKYTPSQGQAAGKPGLYIKHPRQVQAARLTESREIKLSNDRGVLRGLAGDWCVWYSPSDSAIVCNDIFLKTYELVTIPIYVGISQEFSKQEQGTVADAVARLQQLLPNTPLVCIPYDGDAGKAAEPLWFCVVRFASTESHIIKPVLEVSWPTLIAAFGDDSLASLVKNEVSPSGSIAYTLDRVRQLLARLFRPFTEETEAGIVAAQIGTAERFNVKLAAETATPAGYIRRCNVPADLTHKAEPVEQAAGLGCIHQIGAIADQLAIDYQRHWQRLVFATTTEIAKLSDLGPWRGLMAFLRYLARPTLVSLGLLAALGLACFTELSGGCKDSDPFVGIGCATAAWKRWFGPVCFLVFYCIPLVAAWIRYASAKAQRCETLHQDLRLLAECLRVQYVFGVLGRPSCVADSLWPAVHAESGWVRLALRSLNYAQGIGAVKQPDVASQVNWVKQSFLADQTCYHTDNLLMRREAALGVLTTAGRCGLLVFLLCLGVLAAHEGLALIKHEGFLAPMVHHFLLIIELISLAFWGSMRKVADIYALEQELQRGKLVLHALKRGENCLTTNLEPVLHAAQVFVEDQASWHALHRSKPIEAVTGA